MPTNNKQKAYLFTSVIAALLILVSAVTYLYFNVQARNGSNPVSVLFPQIKTTSVQLSPDLPVIFGDEITKFVDGNDKYYLTSTNKPEIYIKTVSDQSGSDLTGVVLYEKTFVPVTNFSSLIDETTFAKIHDAFTADDNTTFKRALLLKGNEQEIAELYNGLNGAVLFDSLDELIKNIKTNDVALVPLDMLNAHLKVLNITDELNGGLIIDPDYAANWPLSVTYIASGKRADNFATDFRGEAPINNRDPEKMTTLIMTGVTAISRGVEYSIARHDDPIYPARGVMDVLSKADITHVNSENPLFDSCEPQSEGIVLCGKTRSIANFDAIGVDIVGLTGNHRNDYGPENNLESIGHLEEHGFEYYGGGKNEEDAGKILYKTVNDTTIAFVGYAYFDSLNGPRYTSLAYDDHPGANFYSEEKVERDVKEARENADIVVVEYQFIENYSYEPIPGQIDVFEWTSNLGADLVMGVQSHQPQWVRFNERENGSEGMIFYGLGNLFFDQMWSLGTRQAIIPRFTFYDGRLISAEVMTTLLHDYAQPRFVTGKDRTAILEEVLP
ncbi:CapA family protein [candidate division WWE3 bacterium]|uniref:CapA family protein n=1 Tax=candidate division WWE3 bacterium TaxID=2053526 RepID=A0A955LKN2_UNCKA|nr:CapA family protein [candidate division WWE3 bacterium]